MAPLVDVSFEEFNKEVDGRRSLGPLWMSSVITLSPRLRPSMFEEKGKWVREVKEDLRGVEYWMWSKNMLN